MLIQDKISCIKQHNIINIKKSNNCVICLSINIYLGLAENASLKFGGEAALPLHYFRSLRQRNIEAYLIVHERTREELEVLFSKDTECIYFISDTFLHLLLWRFSKLLPRRLAYFTFGTLLRLTTQIIQRRIIKRIVKDKKIDVIHQPTPVSPKEPSMIFGMGLPVIFGPMNGGMKYPAAFQYLDIYQEAIERYQSTK